MDQQQYMRPFRSSAPRPDASFAPLKGDMPVLSQGASRSKRKAGDDLNPSKKAPALSARGAGEGGDDVAEQRRAGGEARAASEGVEEHQQQLASCLQHVRSLNAQFASWVQLQLRERPHELWSDGVRDYEKHAAQLATTFDSAFRSLKPSPSPGARLDGEKKERSAIGGSSWPPVSAPAASPVATWQPPVAPFASAPPFNTSPMASWGKKEEDKAGLEGRGGTPGQEKTGSESPSLGGGSMPKFGSPQRTAGAGLQASEGGASFGNPQTASALPGLSKAGPPAFFAARQPLASGFFGAGGGNGVEPTKGKGQPERGKDKEEEKETQEAPSDALQQRPAPAPKPGPGPVAVSAEGQQEEEAEADEGPSVRSVAEEGVEVLHEVKAKLYVQMGKLGWATKGGGVVSIRRHSISESGGTSGKGATEGPAPKPPTAPVRIVFRTGVGRLQLNALLYHGMTAQVSRDVVNLALFSSHEATVTGPLTAGATPAAAAAASPEPPQVQIFKLRLGSPEAAAALSSLILSLAPQQEPSAARAL
eukprot:TRINITY_DN32349_c0_g1_i1.p1 TRINITY_DN32349_c0_g1~~TRINITY_DN32349_c0_g1_i1.p1  ORF type:complete len:534 (-),score=150.93 TRINITY_DN32349_c0_g1_i1:681-2282(-)